MDDIEEKYGMVGWFERLYADLQKILRTFKSTQFVLDKIGNLGTAITVGCVEVLHMFLLLL